MDYKEYNMRFIFHYKGKEQVHTFPEETDVDEAFSDWLFWIGVGDEEVDDLIDKGTTGYYQID